MKCTLPALCAAVLAVPGCSRVATPDGLTLLARYHGAEATTAYTVREANEQVITRAWPTAASYLQAQREIVYGRPVTTVFQHTQCGPGQWRYEVLASDGGPAGAGLIQARDGESGWSYVPAARRLELLTFPDKDIGAMNWMALILNNYNVEGVRRDVVAKAPAWYLEVRPKNPGRPSMRLWVDRETYLPLRQEVWSADGRLVKRTQALERPVLIRAGDLAPLKPPAVAGLNVVRWDQEYRMPEAAIASALGFPLARLPKAPRGFVLVGSYLSLSPGTFGACARWEMSDGIATVNIIQTRNDLGKVAHDDRGSTEQAESGLYHFVVGGNISRPELRRIANSIALQPR